MNAHVMPQKASFSRQIKPAHMRTSRMVGYTLTMMDEATMWELSAVIHRWLQPEEQRALAAGVLLGLDSEGRQAVFDFVEGRCP